jgi:4-hydroxy-tetrahydrodipicolinate reductase
MAIRVAVVGANGRMGALTVDLVEKAPDLELHAAIGSGDEISGMLGADVVVDFTQPGVTQHVVEFAIEHGLPVVVGTSGWSLERIAGLEKSIALTPGLGALFMPNFSLGSVLASTLAAKASKFFDSIEIVEAHHVAKVDSPSGTAVRTAELIGVARSEIGPVDAPHSDQRARGQQVASVPIHSLRMSGVLARQEVRFGGTGETVTISHETLSTSAYEAGILLAVRAAPSAIGAVLGLDVLLDLS